MARRRAGLGARTGLHVADGLALVALAAVGGRYLSRLTTFLINDDEGSYLYAAWRIAQGELPYRDFLTPQLPAFLLPGGALMAVVGPDAGAARLMSACLALLAGVVLWATMRRAHGPWPALLAPLLLLLQPDVFAATRTYRSEPFMLCLILLGTWAFVHGVLPRRQAADPPDRRWLAAAGLLFGLSTLTKLFGPWPLGGLLLWLADDARRRGRPWRAFAGDVAVTLAPAAATVAVGLGGFALLSDAVYEATVEHHLRQGAEQSWTTIVDGGVGMFAVLLRDAGRAGPLALALAMAVSAWRGAGPDDRAARLWAWQLPTALLLLVLSRERYPRHLLYLWPALAALSALALQRMARLTVDGLRASTEDAPAHGDPEGQTHRGPARGRAGWQQRGPLATTPFAFPRLAAVALAMLLLGSWWLQDRDLLWARVEDGTWRVADLIALTTAPEDIVLSDYSELNFYARRPTTYSAASLSSGAVRSGQITWSRLRQELAALGREPALVVLETDSPDSHLAQLAGADRAAFEAWLTERYQPAGWIQRGPQRYAVHARRPEGENAARQEETAQTPLEEQAPRDDRKPPESPETADGAITTTLPVLARFAGGPTLLAARIEASGMEASGIDAPGIGTPGLEEASGQALAAGQRLTVRTAWRAPAAMAHELALTLRLLDAAGRQVAQADGPLLASPERTTDRWDAGELSAQRLALQLPPGLPPGRHELRLGVYRRGGEDLTATAADGRALGPLAPIGHVQVAAWMPPSDRQARSALELSAPPAALTDAGQLGVAGWRLVGLGAAPTSTLRCGQVISLDSAWRRVTPGAERAGLVAEGAQASVRSEQGVERPEDGADRGEESAADAPRDSVGQALPDLATGQGDAVRIGLFRAESDAEPEPDADRDHAGAALTARRDVAIVSTGLDAGAWPVGTVIRRQLRLPIPPDASGPYHLALSALPTAAQPVRITPGPAPTGATGARAAATSRPARARKTMLRLAAIDIAPCERDDLRFVPPMVLAQRYDVELGETARLLGMNASPTLISDDGRFRVELAWRALAPSEEPLHVTVQLLDPAGVPVAAHDGPPAEGRRPTTSWVPGEVILDVHELDLTTLAGDAQDGNLPAGRYTIVTALYRPISGQRLPVTGGAPDGYEEVAPGLLQLGVRNDPPPPPTHTPAATAAALGTGPAPAVPATTATAAAFAVTATADVSATPSPTNTPTTPAAPATPAPNDAP